MGSKAKTILVVEDVAMNRDLISVMLKKLGYHIKTAENGQQAVQLVKNMSFDLILMDLQMPVMNGYDATKTIREELNIDNDKLPIIALTGNVLPDEIARCYEVGMNDYLTKPVGILELAGKLEDNLEGDNGWDIVDRNGSGYDAMPLLSKSELESFKSFVGPGRLQEAFEDFVNDNAARLMIIRATPDNKEIIRNTLHNLTSTSGNLGMKKLSLYTKHLLDNGDIGKEHLDILDSIFRDSCRSFEEYISA